MNARMNIVKDIKGLYNIVNTIKELTLKLKRKLQTKLRTTQESGVSSLPYIPSLS